MFRNGSQGPPLETRQQLEWMGFDFVTALWNTCDRGERPDGKCAFQGKIWVLSKDSTGCYHPEGDEPVYRLPTRSETSSEYVEMKRFVNEWINHRFDSY